MNMDTDILIVGAGPTGLALACQLIRYGIDFRIIDTKEGTTRFSRAIGVQARTLEIYEQIGLADKLIAMGKPAERVRMIERGVIRGEAVLKDIGAGMSAYPFMLVVEQGKHEALLYDHLRSHDRQVEWRTELTSFTQDESGVTAAIRQPDGTSSTIHAKYVVGCDGSKSPVRRALGLTFEGDTVSRTFYVADVQIDWSFSHDAVQICLAQSTITAFFPMVGENRYRIVGTFPEDYEPAGTDVDFAEIQQQIEADIEMDIKISNVNWSSVYKVHSRAVNKFSEGRGFVAGDAAHIHTPAGAQGMNTGIQDGYNLAWKLALAIRDKAAAPLLSTYNEERLPNARHLLRTTDRFFEFGVSDEWFVAYFRTHIFPYIFGAALTLDVVKKAIFPLVSQTGIHYRESTLSVDETGFTVRAGDRMPYFLVGHSIYDVLRAPRFHLIAFGGDGAGRVDDHLRHLIDVHTLPLNQAVNEHFGSEKPFCVLLRPDNYIGMITPTVADGRVARYFAETLGITK
jgi:2-polyprenyl-6-methoxyphenol hydroxylase-like FAD-dependent oxidoreductase